MKNILLTVVVALASSPVLAAESVSENINAKTNNAKRTIKKGAHRAHEAVCMEGDLKCAARKAKNRAVEGKDYVGDKASEMGDKMDADSNPEQ